MSIANAGAVVTIRNVMSASNDQAQEPDLSTPAGRLSYARAAAGYRNMSEFAIAHEVSGVKLNTYRAHEAGDRGLGRIVGLYAQLLDVDESWLLFGTGRGPAIKDAIQPPIDPGKKVTPTSFQRRMLDLSEEIRASIIANDLKRGIRLAKSMVAQMEVEELGR
ncbi:hypothetical protein [Nitrospirillum sp. BR 11163]|uniref:hypothetical protein n=1 Tax=Nitrospirillum sp. BR 11163 TaxID=3104323 RepID=UPI002AFF4DA3|nr:hypothetical protein [Nitrospirillum sp. BR 11163]MEA1674076.1 hypothetical protein [Nitrospirillum sp. BR 11163]